MSTTCFAALKEVCGDKVQGMDRFDVVQQAVEARDEVWRAVHTQRDPEAAKA